MTADPRGTVMRPRETIGDLLRRARLEHGSEIEGVAKTLRIRASYIAAIEQARYDRLPGVVYAIGFVRTYAIHLGLDGDEAVRRFKLEADGMERRRDLSFPMPLSQRSVPGGRMLLAAFVLAICFYGAWYYLSTGDRPRQERVAAVPPALLPTPAPVSLAPPPPVAPPAAASTAAMAPMPSGNADSAPAVANAPVDSPPPVRPAPAAPATAAVSPPADSAPAASAPAPSTMTPVAPPPPATTAAIDTTPVTSPGPPGPHIYGARTGPSRVTLRAIKDCWIQVNEGEQVIAQRILHPGDLYLVPDRTGLILRTGNAIGLTITVDDKPAPGLGGTVRRNVTLDPDRIAAGTAIE